MCGSILHDAGGIHVRREEAIRITAVGFGPVQGEVGTFDQFDSRCRVGGSKGDSDADAHRSGNAVEIVRRRDRRADPIGQSRDLVAPADCGLNDRELVASEASHEIGVTHATSQPRRNRFKQVVASQVSVRVVDVLEPVEVEQQKRRLPAAPDLGEGIFESLVELRAVGQPRQRIVMSQVRNSLLSLLLLGDVVNHHDQVLGLVVFIRDDQPGCVHHPASISRGLRREAGHDQPLFELDRFVVELGYQLRVLPRKKVEHGLANEAVTRQPHECFVSLIDESKLQRVPFLHDDRHRNVFDDGVEELPRLLQTHSRELSLLGDPFALPTPADAEPDDQQGQRGERGREEDVPIPLGINLGEDLRLRKSDSDHERIAFDRPEGDQAGNAVAQVARVVVPARGLLRIMLEQICPGQIESERLRGRPASGANDSIRADDADIAVFADVDRVVEAGKVGGVERCNDHSAQRAVRLLDPARELDGPFSRCAANDRLADEQIIAPRAEVHPEMLAVAEVRLWR